MVDDLESLKKIAAEESLNLITDGMVLGLGTGSTVKFFLEGLSRMVRNGLKVVGVPTSKGTADMARKLGINVDEEYTGIIDLDIDGADEIDSNGNLIKGGGGALLREKLVAYNSKRVCIIADQYKFKEQGLGGFGVPIEVFPYMHQNTKRNVEKLGGKCTLRKNGEFVTDNGNLILDCNFGRIDNPAELALRIKAIPGVGEVGIFTGLCDLIILGGPDGARTIKIK